MGTLALAATKAVAARTTAEGVWPSSWVGRREIGPGDLVGFGPFAGNGAPGHPRARARACVPLGTGDGEGEAGATWRPVCVRAVGREGGTADVLQTREDRGPLSRWPPSQLWELEFRQGGCGVTGECDGAGGPGRVERTSGTCRRR